MLLGASVASGADAPTSQAALTLTEALTRALAGNPDLKVQAFEAQALEGRRLQADTRPNPELSLTPENILGSGEAQGVSAGEFSIALAQVFERGDKRARRVAIVDAQKSEAELALAARQLDVLAAVTRQFVDVSAAQQRLEVARQGTDLATETLAAVRRRVEAAGSPPAELHRARAALARSRIEQQQVAYDLAAAKSQLAAQWGSSSTEFTVSGASLQVLSALPDYAVFASRIPDSITLARFATEERVRDAELRLEQARSTPDVTFSAGVRRLQNTRDQALIVGFSMPLAIRDRNLGAIRESEVRREQSAAQRDAEVVRLNATLFALYQALQQAHGEQRTLREDVIPEMTQALKLTAYAYQRGRYSYLEWVEAQRALLTAELDVIASTVRYHTLAAEIERLIGTALPPTNL